jgi:hypothetical protein
MAIFRKIHVTFWSDSFTSELPNDKKLFYLYLLTNERTKQCGIYEISKRQISFDLGCNIDTVSKQLEYFIRIGKIQYSETTNEIAIKNWVKYNYSSSPKVLKCIESELKQVKNTILIEYLNSIDTLSQEEEEEEEEEEKDLKDFLLSEIKISDVDDDFKQFYEIAYNFQQLFIKNLKEKNAPTKDQDNATFKKYVNPIRLMIKNNECTIENLREVYAYLNSPRGEFWKTNILSTETLRKQITKLVMSSKLPEFKPKKEDKL